MIDDIVKQTLKNNQNYSSHSKEQNQTSQSSSQSSYSEKHIPHNKEFNSSSDYTNYSNEHGTTGEKYSSNDSSETAVEYTHSPFNAYTEEQYTADMSKGYDSNLSVLGNMVHTVSRDSYLVQGAIMLYKATDFSTGTVGLLTSGRECFEKSKTHNAELYENANKIMESLGKEKLDLDFDWSKDKVFRQLNMVALSPAGTIYQSNNKSLNNTVSFSDSPYDVCINLEGFKPGDNFGNYSVGMNNFIKLDILNENALIPISYKMKNANNSVSEYTGFVSSKDLIFGDDSKSPLNNFNTGDYSKNVHELSKSYINGYGTCLVATLSNEKKIAKALESLNIKNASALSVKDIDHLIKKGSCRSIDGKKITLSNDHKVLLEALKTSKEDKNKLLQHKGNKKSFKIAFDKIAQNSYKQSDVYQGSQKIAQMYKVGKTLTNMTCSSAVFLTKQSNNLILKTRLGQTDRYQKISNAISSQYTARKDFKEGKSQLKKNLKNTKGLTAKRNLKKQFATDFGQYKPLYKKAAKGSVNIAKKVPGLNKGINKVENAAGKVKRASNNVKKFGGNLSGRAKKLGKRIGSSAAGRATKKTFAIAFSPLKALGKIANFVRVFNPLNLIKMALAKIASAIWSALSPIILKVGAIILCAYFTPALVFALLFGLSAAVGAVGDAVSGACIAVVEFVFGESGGYTVEQDPYGGAFGDPTKTADGRYPYTMENVLMDHPKNTLTEELSDYYNHYMNLSKEQDIFKNKNINYNDASGNTIPFNYVKAHYWVANSVWMVGSDKSSIVSTGQFLRVKEMLSFINSLYISEFGYTDDEDQDEYSNKDTINKHLFVDYKSAMVNLFSEPNDGSGDSEYSSIINNALKKDVTYEFHAKSHTINEKSGTTCVCSNWCEFFHTNTQIQQGKCDNLIGIKKYYQMSKFVKYDYSKYIFNFKQQVGMDLSVSPPAPKYSTYAVSLENIIFGSNLNKDSVEISSRINCVKDKSERFSSYKYKLNKNDKTVMLGLEINGPSDNNEKLYTADKSLSDNLVDENGYLLNSHSFVESLNLVKLPNDFNQFIEGKTYFPVYVNVSLPLKSTYSDKDTEALVAYVKQVKSGSLSKELTETTRGDLIIKAETIVSNSNTITFDMLVGYITECTGTELLEEGTQGGYICGGHTGCAGHYTIDMEIVQPSLEETFDAAISLYSNRLNDSNFYLKENYEELLSMYTLSMEDSWDDYEITGEMLATLSSSGIQYGDYIKNKYEIISTKDNKTPFDKIID